MNSPWWNDTKYIAVEYNDFVIVYGELRVKYNLNVGDIIKQDDVLGNIIPVLKSPKNGRPASMLHSELYNKNLYTEPKEWINEIPKGLLNPLILLEFLNIKAK